MNIYESYGRLTEEYRQFAASTLSMLRDLKSGRASLAQLEVTETGWDIIPKVRLTDEPVRTAGPKDGGDRGAEPEGVSPNGHVEEAQVR